MDTTTDVLIMGGGAIALSIAIELALQGAEVTILSRDFNQAAVHAAAGMLAPQAESLLPSPMLELCLRSRSLYSDWTRKLEALTGLDTEYWPCGILAPAYAEDIAGGEVPPFQESRSPMLSQWLDQAAIHQQQPGLSPEVVGGWWFPEDAQVNNRALARVLWVAAQELGVNLHEGNPVEAIQQQDDRVVGVKTPSGDWQAEQYILATGAWSGELLPAVPVVPRKGQMLSVGIPSSCWSDQPLKQVLFGSQIYLVPRRVGRIVIGATSEDVGFTPNNTAAGIQFLLEQAMKLYPPLQDFPIQEFWWGFRPATPDTWPILGIGPWENLILATGHYRNGILLAPITAALIADLALHQKADPLLMAFDWRRFRHPS
jgi:thiazole synthase